VGMIVLWCAERQSEPVLAGGGDARQGRVWERAQWRWKAVAYYAEKSQGQSHRLSFLFWVTSAYFGWLCGVMAKTLVLILNSHEFSEYH